MHRSFLNKADGKLIDKKASTLQSERPLLVATTLAVALPVMCAYQQPPLAAFFNQVLAVALWSGVLFCVALSSRCALRPDNIRRNVATLASPVALWALLLAVLVGHTASGITPGFVAAPIAANLVLALLLSAAFAKIYRDGLMRKRWLQALLIGILIAALFNAVMALLQMALPRLADDVWVARMVAPYDRASGNLRQPNQLATLMVWGLLATSYFWQRQPWRWLACSAPLLATLVATGSRTGMVSLLLVVLVALMRSRRVRAWRLKGWLMLAIALLPMLWFAESIFTRTTANAALSLRVALWRDVLAIIEHAPWLGVGWGQFNFAWTLTPLPARAADVFDHAHNLPLHLAVELGVPLATVVLGALGMMLWRARRALQTSDGVTVALLLATMLLHSLFEYPLWFSYFLLPSAALLAWLVAAGSPLDSGSVAVHGASTGREYRARGAFMLAAAALLASVIYATREYQKQVAIHRAVGQPETLKRAILSARQSPLYGHFGDYAAIMLAGDGGTAALFVRPIRNVLDERLLTAYARMLTRSTDEDRAEFVIARAREFPPDAAFALLPVTPASSAAAAALTVQDFRK